MFDLRCLLQRIPALPSDIPRETTFLEGYSTWDNSDASCSLRTKTEHPHRISLRNDEPFTLQTSDSHGFQTWDGTGNNGVALLILGWAYVLNASLAETCGLPLKVVPVETPAGVAPPPTRLLDLGYAQPEEFQ